MSKSRNTPKVGEWIRITTRKCGNQQSDVKIGECYKVTAVEQRNDTTYLVAYCDSTTSGSRHINSSRFDWKITTIEAMAEERFKAQCRKDSMAIVEHFSKEEQTQIAIMPIVIYHIIWHFAMVAADEAASNRIDILKAATRQVRDAKRKYDQYLSQDLDSLHTTALTQATEMFIDKHQRDFTQMYFAVNGEFKRTYPTYPYDVLRSYAIMALLLIRYAEQHNRRMDAMIAQRIGPCKETLLMPAIKALKTLMECYAGIDERYNLASQHIDTSMRIFANNIRRIEFNIL